jgi:dTDP-4-dehydrorhamnose 3,5-epimerase
MHVRALGLDGVIEITPVRYGDDRGFFSETWNRHTWEAVGIAIDFVQDNQSLSAASGTLRGLHFQLPPRAQTKLVRVLTGAIFDVAVDIRKGSPTFGRWVFVELSREKWNQLLVPAGFAHGFVTLVPNTEVAYKVSDTYSPEHERVIRFDDPALGIAWPQSLQPYQLSTKDRAAPLLSEIDTGFSYL